MRFRELGEPDGEVIAYAPGKTEPGVTSDCGNYPVLARGSLQFMNNVWAREKANGWH